MENVAAWKTERWGRGARASVFEYALRVALGEATDKNPADRFSALLVSGQVTLADRSEPLSGSDWSREWMPELHENWNRMNRKYIAAATLLLAGIGAASWWMVERQRAHERYVFEHSEQQQLMQACRKAAWDKLAPATAVLVDFHVEQPGGKSVIGDALQARVDEARTQFEMAQSAEAKQKALQEERAARANLEFDAMARKGEILKEEAKLRQTELSLFDVEMLIRAKTATNAAMEEYVEAENARKAHDDHGYGEVLMAIETQHQASATFRIDAVCTWLKKPTTKESASTVKLAKWGERGS